VNNIRFRSEPKLRHVIEFANVLREFCVSLSINGYSLAVLTQYQCGTNGQMDEQNDFSVIARMMLCALLHCRLFWTIVCSVIKIVKPAESKRLRRWSWLQQKVYVWLI